MISSEDKDRSRLVGLAKRASSEEVQNHLDAFDGHKIFVDFDGQASGEDDFEGEEAPPRGFSHIPSETDKPFYDGLRG
jgi:hypothetical protein